MTTTMYLRQFWTIARNMHKAGKLTTKQHDDARMEIMRLVQASGLEREV